MIDVLIIGGGNAALCAALMAREAGASVMLLEASPKIWRGGNSQHTRNLLPLALTIRVKAINLHAALSLSYWVIDHR